MILFVVPSSSSWNIDGLLKLVDEDLVGRVGTLTPDELITRDRVPFATFIVGNFRLLGPAGQEIVDTLCNQFTKQNPSVPILNHPARAMSRVQLLEQLYNDGINDFRVFRVVEKLPADVRFPIFIRHADNHNGSLTRLIETTEGYDTALDKLVRRANYDICDLMAVEFSDIADENGFYRKYTAFRVGNEIIPRSLKFDTNWVVKSGADEAYLHPVTGYFDKARIREERAYMEQNPHESWLKKVFDLAQIEYGRIDYSMAGDAPRIWEINTHPTFLSRYQNSTELSRLIREARSPVIKMFYSRLSSALREIDGDAHLHREYVFRVSQRLLDQRRRENRASLFHTYRTDGKNRLRWILGWFGRHYPESRVYHFLRRTIGAKLWNMIFVARKKS
ncbi:MAG: hypothetical protein BMS9Abin05_0606 [Rhodothermia bacterium]|nr:MAG: hypothetical protein BMS9Abin05_0606 [Rhodothermia bacterium]